MFRHPLGIVIMLIGTGAVVAAPLPQVLVDQIAPHLTGRPKAELLVLGTDHTMFRIITTLHDSRAASRPELDRGYSLFCGNWQNGPGGMIVTTDQLTESFQYPALDADRAGPHVLKLAVSAAGKDGLPAMASNADHRFAALAKLHFDAAQIERIKFTCAQAGAAAKAK